MRLLLSISRHELPITRILFALPAEQTPISKVLELVNDLVPLESEQWGLEDYAVTVQGYECLHYQDAHSILNEGDQVDIRPVTSTETRQRKVSGRLQVSSAGAHLVDGIAFGRAFNKRSARPAVYIPPLKRPRITHEDESDQGQKQHGTIVDIPRPHVPPTSKPSPHSTPHSTRKETAVEREQNEGSPGRLRSNKPTQRRSSLVRFVPEAMRKSESDPDDSEDADFESAQSEPSSHSSDDSDSISSNDSSSSWDRDSTSDESESAENAIGDESEDESEDENEDQEKISTSGQAEHIDGTKIADISNQYRRQNVPPGQGSRRTQSRNQRRKDSKRRRYLEASGYEPADLSIADAATIRLQSDQDQELEKRRAELLGAIAPPSEDEAPDEMTSKSADTSMNQYPKEPNSHSTAHMRLDVTSSKRLVFNSLGLPPPKTASDEAKLRKRLAQNRGQNSGRGAPVPPSVDAEELPQDDWTTKIDLSAVECVDQDVELSAPPFPFVQRWDPQYRPCGKRSKKRKRRSAGFSYDERDDTLEHIDNELDYGEDGHGEDDHGGVDVEWSETADINEDGVPPLPQDLDTLPVLNAEDCQAGAVIVFKLLEVSQSTNWQPAVSQPKTATIEHFERDTLSLTAVLAKRDRPDHDYDDEGQRIYEKFEMPVEAGDGDDAAGRLELHLSELIEPKLLVGASAANQDAVEEPIDAEQDQSQTDVVQDSVGEARQVPDGRESDSGRSQRSSQRKPVVSDTELGSQDVSVASAAMGLDQAAQLRASMLSPGYEGAPGARAEATETFMDVSMPRDSQIEASVGS